MVKVDNFQGKSSITGQESFIDESVSPMRKVIAQRLGESKFSAPHFYLTTEISMDKTIEARQAINTISPIKISFNDMIVKACAMALQEHPQINSSWLGDTIRYNDHIHIGVAMAVEDGLLVPVVRFANSKRLSEISSEVKEYGQRAKAKKELLKNLNPIMSEYMKEKKIRMIVDKKSILLADENLNLTEEIIEILNKKLKSIKLN